MTAARKGPSVAIMIQVAASGSQKSRIDRWVGGASEALGFNVTPSGRALREVGAGRRKLAITVDRVKCRSVGNTPTPLVGACRMARGAASRLR